MLASILRSTILAAADSTALRRVIEKAPVSRDVVARFVGGDDTAASVRAAQTLTGAGLAVTIDHLGEQTRDRAQAQTIRDEYLHLLRLLADAGLTQGGRVEVSVKMSAIGQALGPDGPSIATHFAHTICAAAAEADTTVTIDMEDHTTTDATLASVMELRDDFASVAAVVQSYLRRTEGDCRDLAGPGSRVRLCKGAYSEPESVAFTARGDVDRSYVRCLKVLMAGGGRPLLATHDPRLIGIGSALAADNGRPRGEYEFQMLFGIRPDEQRRLAAAGESVRVYLPYGSQWYGYLMRRMAERPANTAMFLRAVATRG